MITHMPLEGKPRDRWEKLLGNDAPYYLQPKVTTGNQRAGLVCKHMLFGLSNVFFF